MRRKKSEENNIVGVPDSLDPDQLLTSNYLKSKDVAPHHLNFEEFRGNYSVSTGSLFFDKIVGGGFSSGLIRYVGSTESGKTSSALLVQSNFLKVVPNSKAIYIKAEGRLDQKVKDRVDMKFVSTPEEWEVGTCFIFECNIYEIVFDWIRMLLLDPKNKIRYHIVIDSMDSLLPKDALAKSTGDAPKVAAAAVFSADFLRRTNLYLSKRGHQCIMLSQIRAEIRGQYELSDKNKMGGASGGNAQAHYPDWVVEFTKPLKADWIVPNAEEKFSEKNKPIGRICTLKILKSTNETTMLHVSYPIKFGRKNKSAIWREREVADVLLAWGLIVKNGSWFNSDVELKEKLDIEFKAHGIEALYNLLEENNEIFDKLNVFAQDLLK